MNEKLFSEASIAIDASTADVWEVITTPHLIKKYLIGTDVSCDWKEECPISYKGEYKGKAYMIKA